MRKKLNCILLVDDDKATNYFNQMVLEEADIAQHIETKNNAKDALEFLKTKSNVGPIETDFPRPELIFLDINMPGMDGWEFLEEYQKLPEEQKGQMVIIMLTTSLNPDDRHKAEQIEDVSDFRIKPLSVELLQEILRAHFADH